MAERPPEDDRLLGRLADIGNELRQIREEPAKDDLHAAVFRDLEQAQILIELAVDRLYFAGVDGELPPVLLGRTVDQEGGE